MKRFAAMVILASLFGASSAGADCFNTTINGAAYYICNPPVPEPDRPRWSTVPLVEPAPERPERLLEPPNAGTNGSLVPPWEERDFNGHEDDGEE